MNNSVGIDMNCRTSVFDVAGYILKKVGRCTHMKLQKLAYYAQAWSLVWEEEPLFSQRIEAWANGPVVPELFRKLKGSFDVTFKDIPGSDPDKLSKEQKETIKAVIEFYGDKSPQWLSDLTHSEAPWITARSGIPAGERGSSEITLASMADYYSGL
jgi:uncharacterized phage-associated protein